MADQHSGMDYHEHERTYSFFVALVKWGTISTVIILILMAIFLL
jgi:hypothetical protein